MRFLATLLLALLLLMVPLASAGPTDDVDGDSIPDGIESELCGRAAIRNLINDPDVPYNCESSSDLEFASSAKADELAGQAAGIFSSTYMLVDNDLDLVPDTLEPLLCQVENQNSPDDGSCVGDDYVPALARCVEDVPALICIEDDADGGPLLSELGLPVPYAIHVNFWGFNVHL